MLDDHTVLAGALDESGRPALHCRACGAREAIKVPSSLPMLVLALGDFQATHARCPAKAPYAELSPAGWTRHVPGRSTARGAWYVLAFSVGAPKPGQMIEVVAHDKRTSTQEIRRVLWSGPTSHVCSVVPDPTKDDRPGRAPLEGSEKGKDT